MVNFLLPASIIDRLPSPLQRIMLAKDRATFHFLTSQDLINQYVKTAIHATRGFITIGTFSENGPTKCSGMNIKQYTEDQLKMEISVGFEKIKCIHEDYITPFNTIQSFLFCSFKRYSD